MAKKGTPGPSKGELTRKRILEAALDVIVQDGFAALSHRNVAGRAGVQLSLTSYYFGTLDNLILEAYQQFASQELEYVNAAREKLTGQTIDMDKPSAKAIADYLTEYTITNMTERRRALAIDCKFLFEPDLPEKTKEEVKRFNEKLRDILTEYMRTVGASNPTIDANLLLAVVRNFDFQAVTDPSALKRDWLHSNLLRLVSALLAP